MPTKSKATTDGDKPAKKSLIKPITGKKSAPAQAEEDKKVAAATKAKDDEKKKAPKPEKKATVSLIDEEGKTKPAARPVRKITAPGSSVLPTISKIRDAETPAPAPAEPVAATAAAPATSAGPVAPTPPANATAEVTESGEKILHVKLPIVVKELAAAM